MIVSVNWLKKFVEIDRPIDELAALIGSRLVEIEQIIDLGAKYKDVIVAQVVEVTDHPDADTLHIVHIDDGGVRGDIDRREDGKIQIVCGAPNVEVGMFVAWLPPGATVPASVGDVEPFVLSVRSLRGAMSNGMLASAKELAIGDSHDGIIAIDKATNPGDSFAELYELNDYLLDIENKSLTHRPDCFGLIGFAREIAAIQGKQFTTPAWLMALEPVLGDKAASTLVSPTVTIESPDICRRYQAVVLDSVDASLQSPLQIQTYLYRTGMRPISIAVDTTNYLMLVTGQPLHAFDYDKFVAESSTGKPDVVVRTGQEGEKLRLLDGREITLSDDDIVISAGNTPVALAGAMGGATTEISSDTKRILLEVATFDLYRLRATQMRHGIFSEAITRFTKGQPAELTAPIMASAIRMISDLTGAVRVSDVIEAYPAAQNPIAITLTAKEINAVLGSNYSPLDASAPLVHTEFTVETTGDSMQVTAPYWRADIHIAEDLIEEIGRIQGFDEITPSLPERSFVAVTPSDFDRFIASVRQRAVAAGANEVLTYSFVHGKILERAGQDAAQAFKIINAISPDLQYYRLSLLPSLLSKVHQNSKQGYDSFAIFEINKVHRKDTFDANEVEVPAEFHRLALTLALSPKQAAGKSDSYYEAKYLLKFILRSAISFEPITDNSTSLDAPFQPGRSAYVTLEGKEIGVVGEYRAEVIKNFKLPAYSAGFEIDTRLLFKYCAKHNQYIPPGKFQGTEQDISIQVASNTTYAQVEDVVEKVLQNSNLLSTVTPIDIYAPEGNDVKTITLRLSLADGEKTIAIKDVKQTIEQIASEVVKTLEGKII